MANSMSLCDTEVHEVVEGTLHLPSAVLGARHVTKEMPSRNTHKPEHRHQIDSSSIQDHYIAMLLLTIVHAIFRSRLSSYASRFIVSTLPLSSTPPMTGLYILLHGGLVDDTCKPCKGQACTARWTSEALTIGKMSRTIVDMTWSCMLVQWPQFDHEGLVSNL